MKYLLFLFPLLGLANPTTKALDSLQQLGSLMPERLWFQEFSICVDTQDFASYVEKIRKQKRREEAIFVFAGSKDYLLRTTMSGENIRMLDLYQEFEESPFWVFPTPPPQ